MKSIMFVAFILLCLTTCSQSITIGRWAINGIIITRLVDSVQIEDYDGRLDTLQVKWNTPKQYLLIKPGRPTLTVKVLKLRPWGYSGIITDGKTEKAFELIKIK